MKPVNFKGANAIQKFKNKDFDDIPMVKEKRSNYFE